MKGMFAGFVAAVVLGVFAGQAAAYAPSTVSIEQQTKQVVNKRLRFLGESARATSARCQTDGYQRWFCAVRISQYGTVYYSVKVSGDNLQWSMQR